MARRGFSLTGSARRDYDRRDNNTSEGFAVADKTLAEKRSEAGKKAALTRKRREAGRKAAQTRAAKKQS